MDGEGRKVRSQSLWKHFKEKDIYASTVTIVRLVCQRGETLDRPDSV